MAARPLLHQAAEEDNRAALHAILKSGVPVDSRDGHGNTALQVAAAHGRAECVVQLVAAGAAVDASNGLGWTALMQAARHGHMRAVMMLLASGAATAQTNVMGVTALGLAAVGGVVEVARALMDAGASSSEGSLCPVLLAAHFCQDAMLRVLLDRGASANTAARRTEVTPLMASAIASSASTAELLLARGAKADSISARGLTALQAARQFGAEDVVLLLEPLTSVNTEDRDGAVTALDAVCARDLFALRTILARDPDEAKAVSGQGVTALLAAAVLGQIREAQLLLMHGADIEAADAANGWTPLLHAIYHRHSGMALFLLRHGADIHVVTPKGHTVFDFASEVADFEIIKAYIQAQGDDTVHNAMADSGIETSWAVTSQQHNNSRQQRGLKSWWGKLSNRYQKEKTDRKLPEMDSGSTVLDDLGLPPVPQITGQPILPNLPPRPSPHMPRFSLEENEDLVPAALRFCGPPVDVTSISLRVGSEMSSLAQGRLLLPGEPPPHFEDTRYIVRCNGAVASTQSSLGGGSGTSPYSSLTASSKTTVKTKRSNNTLRPHRPRRSGGAVEQLTLSLGKRQLSEVLHKLSLNDKAAAFDDQEVDFEAFLELTNDDLLELGVTDQLSRIKIMRAIQSLRKKT